MQTGDKMRVFASIGVLLVSFNLWADELDRGANPYQAEGLVMTPLPVRTAPPYGAFSMFVGRKVGKLRPDEKVEIIGIKRYGSFSGMNTWYQIKNVNNLTASKKQPLWVDGGTDGKEKNILVTEETQVSGDQYGN